MRPIPYKFSFSPFPVIVREEPPENCPGSIARVAHWWGRTTIEEFSQILADPSNKLGIKCSLKHFVIRSSKVPLDQIQFTRSGVVFKQAKVIYLPQTQQVFGQLKGRDGALIPTTHIAPRIVELAMAKMEAAAVEVMDYIWFAKKGQDFDSMYKTPRPNRGAYEQNGPPGWMVELVRRHINEYGGDPNTLPPSISKRVVNYLRRINLLDSKKYPPAPRCQGCDGFGCIQCRRP